MSPSDVFYALISSLLEQTAQNPELPPDIPLERWPAGSHENFLLVNLKSALAALQATSQPHPSQAEGRQWDYRSIFESASDGLIITDVETGRVLEVNPAACRMYGYACNEFIGLYPDSFIHPDRSHLFEKYAEVVQSKGVYEGLQVHQRRDGSQFYVELSGAIVAHQGCSYVLSVVRDVSQRVHSEQRLHQRVEARTREQTTLLDISQTLASALELQPGLILDQLQVIIDYTHAGLFKLEDSTLSALAVRGPQRLEQAMPFHIRLENSETLAALFSGQRPSRIADVQSSDPPARYLRSLLHDQASILLEGVQSWMWVPLAIKGGVIGAIGVAHTERDYFTAHHADLALIVANQAAITMVNAELYEHAHELAALQERQRLARNLHDAVNQSLFSAGLIAEVLPRLWEQRPGGGTPLLGGFAPVDPRRAG